MEEEAKDGSQISRQCHGITRLDLSSISSQKGRLSFVFTAAVVIYVLALTVIISFFSSYAAFVSVTSCS